MKLSSKLGRSALFFSVLFTCTINPLLALDVEATDTQAPEYSRNHNGDGWGWNSMKTYLGTLGSTPEQNLKIPVLMGVEVKNLSDSWGDARSNGRTHEGIDILAPRGTPIVSPTNAVVSSTGFGANGGNYVYTINAGGERFYFAHLDSYAPGIASGKVLAPGDVIGYVGNTGNASGGPPHLHFGIYNRGASNPYPRLTLTFTDEEKVRALNKIVTGATDPKAEAKNVISKYKTFLKNAQAKGLAVDLNIVDALGGGVVAVVTTPSSTDTATSKNYTLSRDLKLGSTGEDVRVLQKFLNTHGALVAQTGAGSAGNETTYFGPATKKALALYQAKKGINPTSGYFGPLTRSMVAKEAALQVV